MGKAQLHNTLGPQKYHWTYHAKSKMNYYQLSESRVKRVIKSPLRREEGIAPKTHAAMQPTSYKRVDGQRTWNQEIWTMFQKKEDNTITIISAWRYPGKTKPSQPFPDSMVQEIEEALTHL